ncbi:MAG TPA: MBL fold metallo-hydrolase RNA specificity domain-containing protein, partial [Candidatus Norongarragalinales archaeon]|nr:MBL fold metallo-hydrolase RNA specificity domain-containing protein [Candidatus Norongarragalinales archaeon]
PVRFGSEKKKVALPVKQFDFSAHSSKSELIAYAKKVNPEKIFCIHGDLEACTELAYTLTEEGFDASAPKLNEKKEV